MFLASSIDEIFLAKDTWKADYGNKPSLFYHVLLDEVYGSLAGRLLLEDTSYDLKSYSASKASSDHFGHIRTLMVCQSFQTARIITAQSVSRKVKLPLCINNIKNGKPLPIYGKGDNIRDWLYVIDHAIGCYFSQR